MKKFIKNNNYFILGLSLILFLFVLLFNKHGLNILYWGDSNLCFYETCFINTIYNQFGYVWFDKASSGFPYLFQNYDKLPILIQYPFYLLTGNISLSQYSFLFLLFILGYTISFYVAEKLFDNKFLCLIVGIFYIFNPWIIDRILMGHLGIWIGYSVFPLFLFYFYKIFKKDVFDSKDLLIIIFLLSFLIYVYPHVAYFSIISLGIFGLFLFKNTKIFYKKLLSIFLFVFLILAFFDLPSLVNIFSQNGILSSNNVFVSSIAEFDLFRDRNNILKSFLLSGTFIDYSLSIFKNNFILIFAYFGTTIYIIYSLFFRNFSNNLTDQKTKFIIFSLFLITLFIAKGSSQPFPFLNYYLFENFPLFKNLFRDANKFGFFSVILFCLMILLAFKGKIRIMDKVVLYAFIVTLLIPLYSYSLNDYKGYGPQAFNYTEIEYINILHTDDKIGKILIYPGYTAEVKYPFLHFSVLDFLSINNKLYFINYNQKGLDSSRNELSKNVENNLYQYVDVDNINSFNDIIKKYNIDYIVYYYNIELGKGNYFFDKSKIERFKQFISRNNNFENIYTNYFVQIYKLKTEYKVPHIITSNLYFQKLNPSKYNIYMNDLKSSQDLSFLESFQNDWKLYIKPNPNNSWCKQLEYYEKTNTVECFHTQKFFEGEELSYLWEKPIFDSTHKVANEYANSWTIDPEYIKANYPQEYYRRYIDGSIDIELTLYFKPQSYFYLGAIISMLTFAGCFGYLAWGWHRKRNVQG